MIIGLTGKAGSGKSTASMILHTQLGFHRMKFAGPLKAMLTALGLQDVHIEGALKQEPCPLLCGQTPRYAMQTLGTEWGRHLIGKQLWVRAAMREVHQWRNVVFDDVRYPNEAAAIQANGGLVWRIDRPAIGLLADRHASETELDAILPDAIITNNGTVTQLQEALYALHSEQAQNEDKR